MGKLNGQDQKFTIMGGSIVDGQGNEVPNPEEILYPRYDRYLGLSLTASHRETATPWRVAEVTRDEFGDIAPQPALPVAFGEEEDEPSDAESLGDLAYAAKENAADRREAMVREALKPFSAAEKDALLNEGDGVGARNGDRLVLEGTHYAEMGEDLGEAEDPWMWGLQ